jgi:hypothetical protein
LVFELHMFYLPKRSADIDRVGGVGERGTFIHAVDYRSRPAQFLEVEVGPVDVNPTAVYVAHSSCEKGEEKGGQHRRIGGATG